MQTHSINDPDHWRHRAEEMRALADQVNDDEQSKQTMLRIAEAYDHLAQRAQERASGLLRPR